MNRTTFQQQLVAVNTRPPLLFPEYDGGTPTPAEVWAFIESAAKFRGMNTEHVWSVVIREGGIENPVRRNTAGEPAWGPFQLHVVAEDYRPGFEDARDIALRDPCQGYVGDQFICATGLHPSEMKAWKLAVEFALDYAIRAGTWGAWYGAWALPQGRDTRVEGVPRGFSAEALAYAGRAA